MPMPTTADCSSYGISLVTDSRAAVRVPVPGAVSPRVLAQANFPSSINATPAIRNHPTRSSYDPAGSHPLQAFLRRRPARSRSRATGWLLRVMDLPLQNSQQPAHLRPHGPISQSPSTSTNTPRRSRPPPTQPSSPSPTRTSPIRETIARTQECNRRLRRARLLPIRGHPSNHLHLQLHTESPGNVASSVG